MTYSHTQRSPIWLLLVVLALAAFAAAWLARDQALLVAIVGSFGLAMMVVSLCVQTLTVADEGDRLLVQFGPLPLFRRRIPYSAISRVETAQTELIDGWGIHYIPGRGWVWNIWGRDCVRLTVNGKTLRIGSDDAGNLAQFIQSRVAGG